ncbi:mercuric ion binding protein [Thiogranum longum]|uniref:Mercuric ion binding protein n=1 Tax=Thiogranum longum TaxID=1537524 RepID=A0A4R1H7P9_9GAMM|nr:heavy metal-associated domain-containing protein [Thiogranum longum]TCK17857.1 mercuric ion binding protein [Thiogranum longum]
MKIIRHSIAALTLLFLIPIAQASGPSYALQVDGLACPFCAYGIEKKLSSIEGVDDIQVDIKKGEVIVIMTEGVPLAEGLAREKVKDAGFTLRAFSQRNGEKRHEPE